MMKTKLTTINKMEPYKENIPKPEMDSTVCSSEVDNITFMSGNLDISNEVNNISLEDSYLDTTNEVDSYSVSMPLTQEEIASLKDEYLYLYDEDELTMLKLYSFRELDELQFIILMNYSAFNGIAIKRGYQFPFRALQSVQKWLKENFIENMDVVNIELSMLAGREGFSSLGVKFFELEETKLNDKPVQYREIDISFK